MTTLAIDMIRRDGGTQMRVSISDATVESYATDMEASQEFPAVVVFYDGKAHWLADGFHRIAARQRVAAKHVGTDAHSPWAVIDADVRAGTREDAIRYAIGANKKNGLRRTNADKQVAVRAALSHPEMSLLSDGAIAREVGVSQPMVSAARQVINFMTSDQIINSTHKAVNTKTDIAMRTGVDGKQYPVRQKSQITKSKAPEPAPRSARVEQATTSHAKQKHICPHCNGTGFIE